MVGLRSRASGTKLLGLGGALLCTLATGGGGASATPAADDIVQQQPVETPSTADLDAQYSYLRSSYDQKIGDLRGVVARAKPASLRDFDTSNRRFEAYVRSECDTNPDKLLAGGSSPASFGLRCRIALYSARIDVMQGEYAQLQH